MYVWWLLATLHLLALGMGLGAITVRAAALRGPYDQAGLDRIFRADTLWGLAALVWIATGLWRAFGGVEKGSAYYLASPAFHAKMGLLILILLLEIAPMIALIRWRAAARKGDAPDTGRAATFSAISVVQAILVVAMVFAATAMARGIFA
jgi:putative membrane protein